MEQFLELYKSVYKDLYRLAYYYLGNSQDAEDVVSETVLKAKDLSGKRKCTYSGNSDCYFYGFSKFYANPGEGEKDYGSRKSTGKSGKQFFYG